MASKLFRNSLLRVLVWSSVAMSTRPRVSTCLGEILGYYKTSFSGREFAAYEGIPYAKPPIGDLRFEEPVPISPWIGVWNATYHYRCIQDNFQEDYTGDPRGTEDCLYLNVFVPRESSTAGENLDVLVYIHGGAFRFHSGLSYAVPDYIMDREVVYVTINYRLGIFGFLSAGDEVLPGNYGLKDQVLALKWIQNHIRDFGGNPNSVTIFGISADDEKDFKIIFNNWNFYAPYELGFHDFIHPSLWNATAKKLWSFYVGDDYEVTKENIDKYVKLTGGKTFFYGNDRMAKAFAEHNKSPVYALMLDYPRSGEKYLQHAEDGPYYFRGMDGSGELTPEELKITNVLMDMLVAYARNGKPTIQDVQWKPTKSAKFSYLKISGYTSDKMKMETLDELYPTSDFLASIGF